MGLLPGAGYFVGLDMLVIVVVAWLLSSKRVATDDAVALKLL